jgi:LmbE family N-acetylglucosaminyl deacetylase
MSGLPKIVTMENDMPQHAWRPKLFLTYIQDYQLCPDLVVDITDFFETKIHAIGAYASQFYNPNSTEPETYISTFDFWKFLEARSRNVGHLIGTTYGEGFQSEIPLKVSSLLDLV